MAILFFMARKPTIQMFWLASHKLTKIAVFLHSAYSYSPTVL